MAHAEPAELDPPPSEEERKAFRRTLKSESVESIRDKVLSGEYGFYDPADPRRSHWQPREANRYITAELKARELRPQWIGIILSTIIGVAALIVAILAYAKDSA